MKKAIITKKDVGTGDVPVIRYFFSLHAVNGEEVAKSSQKKKTYTEKHSCVETLESCFPDFEIVDKTGEASN